MLLAPRVCEPDVGGTLWVKHSRRWKLPAFFSMFSQTKVFEKNATPCRTAREIKALRFSKIVLERLFSVAHRLDEFQYRRGSTF